MPTLITAARCAFNTLIQRSFLISLLLLLLLSRAQAQTTPTDGMTPLALSPGAPAGSFALSGFENVNLYNGHLNFHLPLLSIGGRGGAQMTMTLPIESAWQINEVPIPQPGGGVEIVYVAVPNFWEGIKPGYGPGVLQGRRAGWGGDFICPDNKTVFFETLTRLTFTAPDGTEFELRDQNSNGQPANQGCSVPASRGQVFVTADGTAATFISDTIIQDALLSPGSDGLFFPSGFLMLRDGTRYRIDNGKVSWLRDRNGNKMTFAYDAFSRVTSITDSLNRNVTVCYAFTAECGNTSYDLITFHGSAGTQRTIRVWYANLGDVLRTTQPGDVGTPQTMSQLFPPWPTLGNGVQIFNRRRVSSVELPNGQTYQFRYNAYGELARVALPTGGAFEYDYTGGVIGDAVSGMMFLGDHTQIYRRVVTRRVYLDGTAGSLAEVMTYSRPESLLEADLDYVVVDHYKSDGVTRLKQERHYFHGKSTDSFDVRPTGYSPGKHGRERQTEYLDADGVTLLRRVVNTWQQRPAATWFDPNSDGAPPNDPRIVETVTTLTDANLVSKQTFGYDQYNNQTDANKYDFGAGAPGPLIRRSHTDYLTLNNGVDYAADTGIHIRNLPLRTQVFDAGEIKRAETSYEYDLYDNSPNHAPLTARLNISGHDVAFSTGYLRRGNATRTSRALLNNSGDITGSVNSHAQYDIAGNVVKAIDANGNSTTLDFSDRFDSSPDDEAQSNAGAPELAGGLSYAFPTKVTNALDHTAYIQYDYYLGAPVNKEDINGVVSSVAYNDLLDRPTQGIQARYKVTTLPCEPPSVCVPAEKKQTTITYDDANRVITTTSDRVNFDDNLLKSEAVYDGLGRTIESRQYETVSSYITVSTIYDALGRVSQVSNPHRTGDPVLWTATEYDALGRVIKVTTPDGAHVDTAYSGNNTLVIDQAGKKRISRIDALGRLTKVWEVRSPDAASGTVSISFPNHPEVTAGYQTDYLYDPMDNLRKVTQGEQKRWFAYDSLSRLIRAKNPEQAVNSNLSYTDPVTNDGNGWSMAYSYDANGNLVSKTDARNITTTYDPDALNRNTTVSYSDSTPSITNTYDTATLGKGRLQKTETAGSMGSRVTINAYDAMGRPRSKSQQFFHLGAWGTSYTTQQIYDLAGNVKRLTYPSDRFVDYIYDQAGRLSSFSGNLGGSQRTYADMIKYNAAGQMIKEHFGTNTPLYHNSHYNNRMQMVSTRVGNIETDELNWSRGKFDFFYGTTAVTSGNPFANDTDNNGNLRRQLNFVPLAVGGHVIPQRDDYAYDALNRVISFTEAQMNSSEQWTLNVAGQDFSYDRYGNRQITSAIGGVSNYNPFYDEASNRINGLGYDAAGNITFDPASGGTMTYDAENRLMTATSGGGGNYVYNADGKRVRRITAGQETWHVYGCGGELLAEYAVNGAPSTPQKEYGYRGGQLLIVTESGSGGGVSFVKPALKSSADLIGMAGLEAEGNADGLFEVDEPVADLEFNEDSGSTTADVSSDNNTGTHIDGVTGTTAKGYGNSPSANGVGGELLAEHPAGAAPSEPNAPQKEYRNRKELSIVTAQGGGIVTMDPSANQTPVNSGDLAVTSPSNTGHGSTITASSAIALFGSKSDSDARSARWSAFQPVSGTIGSIRLKFNWSVSCNASASASEDGGSASSHCGFNIDYSLDGGSSWINRVSRSLSVTGNDSQNLNDSASEDILLSPGQNITQVQVRDSMSTFASANRGEELSSSALASITTSISIIRLEVDTAPVISNVAAGGITTSSALITWNTNENSDSQVEYGPTTAYGQSTPLDPALVTAHSQVLSGLTAGTPYHYRVKSRDAAGNLTVSDPFTFTTAPETTPPTVTFFSPAAGATNVNPEANVTITFSEAMDATTVNGSTVELRDPSNALVSATVSYNAASLTATLNPNASLAAGATYTARVKGGGTDPRVKDMAGNALAADVTWTFTTAQNGSSGIKWLVTDHLGSTRMVIDETGSLEGIKRHDYAPFGEELYAGIRRNGMGQGQYGYEPPPSNVRQKFGTKERDNETGLDYFGARYFASVQGRFTSADPLLSSGRPDNPQTWNRYSYVLNNPLFYVDPSGMFEFASNLDDDEKQKIINAWVALNQALNEHKEGSRAYNNIKRSLDRLGRPGDPNGITVTIGQVTDNNAAETRVDGIARGKVTIKFDRDHFNSKEYTELAGTLGHEGSHAADAFKLFSDSGRSVSAFRRLWNSNDTQWKTELEAWFVDVGVHEAWTPEKRWGIRTETPIPGQREGLPGRDTLWNPSWKNVDRQTIENNQAHAIGNLLQTPERIQGGYGLKRPRN